MHIKPNKTTVILLVLVIVMLAMLGMRWMVESRSGAVAIPNATYEPSASPQAVETANTGDFFTDFRAQRETARADEIALLDAIIKREGAPEQSIRDADARRITLTRATEQERAIEKLLVAKGFEDVAAYVLEGTVTVCVKQAELTDEDTAKILDQAMRATGFEAGNVKIIPVAPE